MSEVQEEDDPMTDSVREIWNEDTARAIENTMQMPASRAAAYSKPPAGSGKSRRAIGYNRLRARAEAAEAENVALRAEIGSNGMSDKVAELDAMLCQMFARRAPIEETLLAVASGKRDLLTREECKAIAARLGVPVVQQMGPA
ncbi:MAG: hypothetical protein JWM36_3171 [Hyphomicrobiales bacterium]|nr:hypothetical protein [Hyphomicrobiales bacterium]